MIARVIALWVFGLLGASIFGGIVGHGFTHSEANSFFGVLGGAFVFACARLWLTSPGARQPRTEMPVHSAHTAEGRTARFAKWIAGTLAFGLMFAAFKYGMQWVRENEPGLNGSARTAFVDSANRECVATQTRDPDNKGISAKIISDYCTCYANNMADRVSVREVKQYSEIGQDRALNAMQSKITAAAEPCLDAIAKVTGGNAQTSR